MVGILFFAQPVTASAPILTEPLPLVGKVAIATFAHDTAVKYGIDVDAFVTTLSRESMGFTWNDQSLVPADGPNGREDSWGICQINLPGHPDITKKQALDPRWCIEWSAQQFKEGRATMWTEYRNYVNRVL